MVNKGYRYWFALLGVGSWLMILLSLYLVFFVAPTERTMGDIQKIFYFHVSSAWTAFLAFFVVFVCSILYLKTQKMHYDQVAQSAAEIGFVFTTVVLTTGPLWAKPVWFVWWTWDTRLTSTLILWLVYAGYFLLRNSVVDNLIKAKLSAAIGILAFVDIPIIYFSIRWWRTQHPAPVFAGGEGSGLNPEMRTIFFISLFSFTLFFIFLMLLRYRNLSTAQRIDFLAVSNKNS